MAKITISGLVGSGTSSLAKALGNFGFEYKSTGDFFKALASENKMTPADFADYCKAHPKYDRMVDEETARYGRSHDSFALDSRLAWHFIPDSLKVKLYCDLNTRAARILSREGGNIETIREDTKRRDESDRLRYLELYGIEDFNADENFDLVLDSQKHSTEELARIVYGHIQVPILR